MTGDAVGFEVVRVQVADGLARVELNRPEAANAFDLPAARRMAEVVDRLEGDDVRVVLLTAAGARFCAGGDVRSFVEADDWSAYVEQLASTLDQSLQRLAAIDKPVVAAVHGAVAGAGLGVVLTCDLVVAGASTKFVAAYSSIGLTPDCGVSWLLPRAVGQQRALDLMLTGRVLTCEEARDWGIVTQVVPDDEVRARAEELAVRLAEGPAGALGQTKRLIRESWDRTRAETGADEARTIGRSLGTPEAQHLVTAFTSR